jgi:hypothetical protein
MKVGYLRTLQQEKIVKSRRLGRNAKILLCSSASLCVIVSGGTVAWAQANTGQAPSGQGANIQVQEHQPNVTVHEQQPQVTVQQPKPQVTVSQPKPQVSVQEPQPNVHVQQEGQPKVNVQQQGTPQVTVEKNAAAGTQQNQPAQPQANPGAAAPSIASLQPNQIQGKKLYDRNDKEVATINKVEQGANGQINAVVAETSGGFLGLGSKQVTVPATDLELQGNKVIAKTMTANQIQNLPVTANQK